MKMYYVTSVNTQNVRILWVLVYQAEINLTKVSYTV